MKFCTNLILLFFIFWGFQIPLFAKVINLEIEARTVYQNGKKFGDIGTYDELKGKVYFEIDPLAEANQQVVDVQLAQRNNSGKVAFTADIVLLLPTDKSKINGSLIYEFNNRGGMLLPYVDAPTNALFNRGFIFVSTGWIGELLPNKNKLRLCAPIAYENDKTIKEKIRVELIGQKGKHRLSVNGQGHGAYEPTGMGYKTATLTKRMRESDDRKPVPTDQFFIESSWENYSCRRDGLPKVELVLQDSFEANYIYELIYEAKNPIVQGLGFVGIRDIIAFLRNEKTDANPLLDFNGKLFVDRTLCFGISQSGRAIRMFLYQGFNVDENGRQVFDGAIPMVAGAGMGFFNHRFASPTRFSTQRESHLYLTDIFPFTYSKTRDPFSNKVDGLLERCKVQNVNPKIMHIQSSAEYWHRCAALSHTTPDGKGDAEIPENVRIYSIVGQHGSGNGIPNDKKAGTIAGNHTYYSPLVRSFIVACDDWVREVKLPPVSVYPSFKSETLVEWKANSRDWKSIPNIQYPKHIQQAFTADFGANFEQTQYISQHPPIIQAHYPIFVAKLDADNNEMGLLKMPAVAIPTGTYTGWNLRTAEMEDEGALLRLTGGYIPFAKTKKERMKNGDPRLSMEERYENFETYYLAYKKVAKNLVSKGYLMEEEVEGLLELVVRNKELVE